MKKIFIACAAAMICAAQAGAQSAPMQQPSQGMMTEGGQMPAMKQLKQLEMMVQDTVQVMADIVRMQQKIIERSNGPGKKQMTEDIADLSARVNTLAAGMRGMVSAQGTSSQKAAGGAASQEARDPRLSAPRIQEKSEAGVRAGVSLESSNGILVFRLVLDSDTDNLDQYAFNEVVSLRAVGGREFLPRVRSQEGAVSHRSAILEFDNPGTREYEIVIRGIAGVPERVFAFPF